MTHGKKHDRLRAILVISEVALACVLLVGAGLLLRSFLRVLDVDLGFQPSRAAAITVDYDDGGKPAKRSAILQEILSRVKAIPGIETAGITDMVPLDRNRGWNLSAKGREARKGDLSGAFVYMITPGYLDAMGMQLRAGRDFTWHDSTDSEHVVILNKSAADYFWPGEDPIGRLAIVNGMTPASSASSPMSAKAASKPSRAFRCICPPPSRVPTVPSWSCAPSFRPTSSPPA